MLSVSNVDFMLSVIMLNVVILSVVAPKNKLFEGRYSTLHNDTQLNNIQRNDTEHNNIQHNSK